MRFWACSRRTGHLRPYFAAFEAVLFFYAAGAHVIYTLADHDVTRDEVFAIGATFTLVAYGFASVYTVYQAIEPGGFTAAAGPTGERTWVELMLLSFSTLSSVGIGDVVPIKPVARSLVMLEQLAGLAFVAGVVSRFVALTIRRAQRSDEPAASKD